MTNYSIPFSVLLPLYDKEIPEHLTLCLQSIAAQSVVTDDLIIVLDGPINAKLMQVINSYHERLPIRILALEKNQGLGCALNAGLKICKNKWILRVDSDDICPSNRFQLQTEFIKKHPNIDAFSGHVIEFGKDVFDIKGEKKVPLGEKNIHQYIKRRNPINHMAVAYKKQSVLDAGGYQPHFFMEDYNLWIRMLKNSYHLDNMDTTLMYARVGNGMITRRRGKKYIDSEFKLAKLKYQTKIDTSLLHVVYIFFIRCVSRILPTTVLSVVYLFLRHH